MAAAIEASRFQWGPFASMYFGTTYPTASTDGTFALGDVIINTAPTTGGIFCYVCITAGSPGTWNKVVCAAVP
jgi:hypothetical protein